MNDPLAIVTISHVLQKHASRAVVAGSKSVVPVVFVVDLTISLMDQSSQVHVSVMLTYSDAEFLVLVQDNKEGLHFTPDMLTLWTFIASS